jgi:hypothetical protein
MVRKLLQVVADNIVLQLEKKRLVSHSNTK